MMNLRKHLRTVGLARQMWFRTWVVRYLLARLAKKRSFAQAGEDLKVEELVRDVKWFVDIGANDGITASNTFYFALKGAHGVCFEPVAETYTKLRWLYLFNPRVHTIRCGISNEDRTAEIIAADFLSFLPETEDGSHVSVGSSAIDRACKQEIVLKRFEEAIDGLGLPAQCDLLSVDVEGHELNVLESIPFDRYLFRSVVIETHLFDSSTGTYKWRHRDLAAIDQLLAKYGYSPVHHSWLNTIYLPSKEIVNAEGATDGHHKT
jgi:FkbM family methyltransferase